ncbi:membrane protein [Paenibacillus sp. 32O-W]|nr:membrane protein [Paenibacillus sp. 32O-W]
MSMRRITWIAAIVACFSMLLAGCGAKDADSIVKELDKVVGGMESYKGSGTMTLHTGQEPLEYKVEVWYQKPQYYRIALTNAKKDITQIVLRNDEGVFVLTPKLNKVFRFQSDWPQNQGQVYLYQTLVRSIVLDNSRQFAVDDNAYVFDVMASYQNGSLARQKIWLDKKDYAPRQVEVSDSNATVMVQVKFDSFEFDTQFDKSAFDTQTNLNAGTAGADGSNASGEGGKPETEAPDAKSGEAATTPETGGEDVAAPGPKSGADGEAGTSEGQDAQTGSEAGTSGEEESESDAEIGSDPDAGASADVAPEFVASEPTYLPEGVSHIDSIDIVFGGNAGVMHRYGGTYNYTLIQTQPKDVAASFVPGFMIDLGFTMGSISGEEPMTLTWTYDGMEYRLTSSDLTEEEMIKIAQSVQNEATK